MNIGLNIDIASMQKEQMELERLTHYNSSPTQDPINKAATVPGKAVLPANKEAEAVAPTSSRAMV